MMRMSVTQFNRIRQMRLQGIGWKQIEAELDTGVTIKTLQRRYAQRKNYEEHQKPTSTKSRLPAEGFPALKYVLQERLQRVQDRHLGEYWTLDGQRVTIQEAVKAAREAQS